MAPTKSTQSRPTTRSVTRKNGSILRSLVTDINKRFQCIICEKHLGSRAALSRHFHSHRTRPEELSPFTHRSCWDDDDVAIYPSGRQHVLDMIADDEDFDALPSNKQQAIKTKMTYAFAGVKNKKQLQWKAEQKRLRLLHWWFRANEESLRARMEFGPEGLFPRQGSLVTLKRQPLKAKLTVSIRRTQAPRPRPSILRRGHHSRIRQPAQNGQPASDPTT